MAPRLISIDPEAPTITLDADGFLEFTYHQGQSRERCILATLMAARAAIRTLEEEFRQRAILESNSVGLEIAFWRVIAITRENIAESERELRAHIERRDRMRGNFRAALKFGCAVTGTFLFLYLMSLVVLP